MAGDATVLKKKSVSSRPVPPKVTTLLQKPSQVHLGHVKLLGIHHSRDYNVIVYKRRR